MIYVQVRQQNGKPLMEIPCATVGIAQDVAEQMRSEGCRTVLADEGFVEWERIEYVPLSSGHSYVNAPKRSKVKV